MFMFVWLMRRIFPSLVSVVTVLALLFGAGAISVGTATTASATDSATAAVNWAEAQMGSTKWDVGGGECLLFASTAYKSGANASIGGANTAYDYWTAHASAQHAGDTNPPVGAFVFWGPTPYGRITYVNASGHVALSIGGGSVISSVERGIAGVHEYAIATRNAAGYPYLGWMMPPGVSAPTGSSGTGGSGSTVGVGTSLCKCGSVLGVNEGLYQGQYIESPDGQYVLLVQTDGNLVEYGPGFVHTNAMYSSARAGSGAGYYVLQSDGNFVGYLPNGQTAIYGNGANGRGGSKLVMQNDGNVVEYTVSGVAVWASNTGVNNSPPAYKGGDELQINEGLYQGQYIESENGRCFAMVQADGTLVLYTGGDHTFWGAGSGSGAGYYVLQSDGNFVGYMPNGQTSVYGNGKSGSGGNYLVLQDDCNLVEYQANGQTAVWASNTAGLT